MTHQQNAMSGYLYCARERERESRRVSRNVYICVCVCMCVCGSQKFLLAAIQSSLVNHKKKWKPKQMQWKPCENFFAVMLKVFSTFFFILKVGERLTEFGRGSQSLFGFGNILSLRLLLRLLLFNLWFAYLAGGKRGGEQSDGGKLQQAIAAIDCATNTCLHVCLCVYLFVLAEQSVWSDREGKHMRIAMAHSFN